MDSDFWHNKWQTNDISFHLHEPNLLLVQFFESLQLPGNSRIFLPLCGKTLDIEWLLAKGFRIIGVELSEIAIQQLFHQLGIKPAIIKIDQFIHFSAPGIDIFVGDIFNLTKELVGEIHAIYDRAALVALPEDLRTPYACLLQQLSSNAPQLLICYVYDQSLMAGPPFSINTDEIHYHYGKSYNLTLLYSKKLPNGLKGICDATENAWLLMPYKLTKIKTTDISFNH